MNSEDKIFFNGFIKTSVIILVFFIGLFFSEFTSNNSNEEIYKSKIDSLTFIQDNLNKKIDSLESNDDSIKIIIEKNTNTVFNTRIKIDTVWKELKNVEKPYFDSVVNNFINKY